MSFEEARAIADAVLLEGYALYPYRSDSTKNRYRWTFGVLAPPEWAAGSAESSWLEAQVLVEGASPCVRGRLRFLQVVDRRIEVVEGDAFRTADRLDVDGRVYVAWEEGSVREVDFTLAAEPRRGDLVIPFSAPEQEERETLHDKTGRLVGRVVRAREAVVGRIIVRSDRAESDAELLARVTIRVENLTPSKASTTVRATAMRASCISAHVLLAVENGIFLSLLDPPMHALRAASMCTNVGVYPVLAGRAGTGDVMLCSPIILYDHPQIAPESPGDFFDATEIDALLTLRTKTLTPDEMVLARATDPRTAALLDRVETLDHETLGRLHGVMREERPVPQTPRFVRGTHVRLRLDGTRRRTDAQDLLYAGRTATIEDVREDVDGQQLLLVTIDDDPAVELHRWKGRFHYYYADEVEVIGQTTEGA
jgi:hypothetical protein